METQQNMQIYGYWLKNAIPGSDITSNLKIKSVGLIV